MSDVASQVRWFAVTVKPQHEKKAATALAHKAVDCFLPLYHARRRWSDRVKDLELPLFPGYVFCQFRFDQRLPIMQTPGVTSIVTFGGKPAPIPERDILSIRTMISSGLKVEPWPFLKAGQRIRVEAGPLDGLEGILLEVKNSLRVVVSLDLLQRAVAVEIDRRAVCPISPTASRSTGSQFNF